MATVIPAHINKKAEEKLLKPLHFTSKRPRKLKLGPGNTGRTAPNIPNISSIKPKITSAISISVY
jgi:hypothetical protein